MPPFRITKIDDCGFAYWHIHKILGVGLGETLNPEFSAKASKAFVADFIEDPEALQGWCDKFLSKPQFESLKLNIRKARQRKKQFHSEKEKKISVTEAGHQTLAKISKRTNLSYDQIIAHYLQPLLSGQHLVVQGKKRGLKKLPKQEIAKIFK